MAAATIASALRNSAPAKACSMPAAPLASAAISRSRRRRSRQRSPTSQWNMGLKKIAGVKIKYPDGIEITDSPVGISYNKTLYTFPQITLFSFNTGGGSSQGSNNSQGPGTPQLGTLYPSGTRASNGSNGVQLPAGTLVLNVGPYASDRAVDPTSTNANYVVDHAVRFANRCGCAARRLTSPHSA